MFYYFSHIWFVISQQYVSAVTLLLAEIFVAPPACLFFDVVEEVHGGAQVVGPDDGEPSPGRPFPHLHQAVDALKPALPPYVRR